MNQIYFVGYDGIHEADFKYEVEEGFNCYLLILTTTPALFRIDGKIREYPAHTAILYPPNQEIWYGAAGQLYGNNWIRFASDESFVTNFPQPAVPFSVSDPEYCHTLFQLLTWETSHLVNSQSLHRNIGFIAQDNGTNYVHNDVSTKHSDLVTSQLLRILFSKLHDDIFNHSNIGHDYELLTLRRQISLNPQLDWNIADMAKQLHISTGYLQLLYKQKFNISCMDDVISYRLFKARDLLMYTNESISEVAEQCGYNNTEHFCRQFRKIVGVTPGQFRKIN